MIYLFYTCVCIQRDFPNYIFARISFFRGEISFVLKVLISGSCTHVVPNTKEKKKK